MLSRWDENKDLFLEVSGQYKSGAVTYPFTLSYDGENYFLTFHAYLFNPLSRSLILVNTFLVFKVKSPCNIQL